MQATRKYERMGSAVALNDELPPLSLELVEGVGTVLMNRDFSTAIAWRLNPPCYEIATESQQETAHTAIRSLLNQIPDNFELQVRWVQSSRSAEFVKRLAEHRPIAPGFAGEVVTTSTDQILDGFRTHQLAWKSCVLVLIRTRGEGEFTESGEKGEAAKGLGKIGRILKTILPRTSSVKESLAWQQHDWEKACTELRDAGSLVESLLRDFDERITRLDDAGWMDLFFSWANKSAWDHGDIAPAYRRGVDIPLTEYWTLSDWEWGVGAMPRNVAYLDGLYHSILSLHLPPDELQFPVWEPILGASLRCELIANLSPTPVRKRIDRLMRKRRQVFGKDSMTKGGDPTKEAMKDDIDQELQELGAGTEKLFRGTWFIQVWGTSVEEVLDACHRIKAATNRAAGGGTPATLIQESNALWRYYRATCPGYAGDKDRFRSIEMLARKAAHLVPLHGQPIGLVLPRIGALFPTSNGSLLNIDFHDRTRFNVPHFVISAGSGMGKSVLAASLLVELIGPDGRAVVVDRGGSFKGLAAAFGAPYIDFRSRNFTLNPLDFDTSSGELDDDVISATVCLLGAMIGFSRNPADAKAVLKGDENRLLHACTKAVMSEHLDRTKENDLLAMQPTISDVVRRLGQTKEGEDLSRHLDTWSNTGPYGKLFDGPSTMPGDNRVTVIDLGQDTTSNSDLALQSMIGMVLLNQAGKILNSYKAARKFLVFDELAQLVKNKTLENYVDFTFRTYRKMGVSCGALSQKILDAQALLPLCSHYLFLRQDDARDLGAIQEALKFSPRLIDHVAELETRSGEYSEFALLTRNDKGVSVTTAFNVSHPLKYAMITSSREDVERIRHFLSEGMSMEASLRRFAEEYPRGVLARQK